MPLRVHSNGAFDVRNAQIGERLNRHAAGGFVGRREELGELQSLLQDEGPSVVYLHGLGGMGKTSLVKRFCDQARQSASVIELDGRNVEPTEEGFLQELGQAIGVSNPSAEDIIKKLDDFNARTVIVVDTYELLRLIDTWLRQTFVPSLPSNVRVILSGRQRPSAGWLTDPGWQVVFRSVSLRPLSEQEALEALERLGVDETSAPAIQKLAKGHPLALALGAGSLAADLNFSETEDRIISELSHRYLETIPDKGMRSIIEAISVVRRVTHPMLAALIPDRPPEDVFARLGELPFVNVARDGLIVHDTVREAMSSSLSSTNPYRVSELRNRAWKYLTSELERASDHDLWRFTADLLYLSQNPLVRGGFFPSDYQPLSVEPARLGDVEEIRSISAMQEGPESLELYELWWKEARSSFKIMRDQNGETAGFYISAELADISKNLFANDPVLKGIEDHFKGNSLPSNQSAFIIRKWLGSREGEAPSQAQAACWLDVKRTYVSMRRSLRRVYVSASDISHFENVLPALGFKFLDGAVNIGDRPHHTAVLDFGPGLVVGWMGRVVGAELGQDRATLLDEANRELVVAGERKPLTVREFEAMRYLTQREGQITSRDTLLEDVWGIKYDGASNVVDVVIRSLRKKLGSQSNSIETIRGVGYRFHNP